MSNVIYWNGETVVDVSNRFLSKWVLAVEFINFVIVKIEGEIHEQIELLPTFSNVTRVKNYNFSYEGNILLKWIYINGNFRNEYLLKYKRSQFGIGFFSPEIDDVSKIDDVN